MAKQQQLTIRMEPELYRLVKQKCNRELGVGISPLIKIFLKAFVTQDGVGFFVGNVELRRVFNNWLSKKYLEIGRKGSAPLPGPTARELYRV